MTTIEQLADRIAIQDVLVRYCRGIDRCDAAMQKSAYWEDATDDHGSFNGNAWAFSDYVIPALKRMERTMHLISNVYVELNGSSAKCETYCVAHHLLPENGEMVVGGRYLDRMEKRGGEWRIQKRVYVMDWNQNNAATVQWDNPFYSQLRTRGSRSPDDPWYSFD